MKLKYLFLCVISFVWTGIFATLDDTNSEHIALEHRILAENIFVLLSSGHSIDDVITFLNKSKEQRYDNTKLIQDIQNLLHQELSKKELLNIVVNNEESEKFYAWENFRSKLETCAIIAAGLGILYLLYKFCEKGDVGIPLPFFEQKPQASTPPSVRHITKKEKKVFHAQQKTIGTKKSKSKRGWPTRFRKVWSFNRKTEKALKQELEYARSIGAL